MISGRTTSNVYEAGLAQSVERQALNLVVVGSSPTAGATFLVNATNKNVSSQSRPLKSVTQLHTKSSQI
jgi:hypothetical protein